MRLWSWLKVVGTTPHEVAYAQVRDAQTLPFLL